MTDLFTEDKSDKNYLEELVGEGKKFKTQEDLAKGKYEADLYIKDLERQKDELREDYLKLREEAQTRENLKEMINQLSTLKGSSEPAKQPEMKSQTFDPASLDEIFSKKLREHEVSKNKEQNSKFVVDALKQRYGHSYMDVLQKQTEELGLSKEAVNYLAETAPKALMKQLGLDEAPRVDPFQAPPRKSALFSTVKGEDRRTWSFYQKMKTDQPALYFNPKTQVQMHKDYQTLGPEFEDGDFLTNGQESAF